MKKLIVEKEFWELFPDAMIGVLSVKNVRETAQLGEEKKLELKNLLDSSNEIAKKYVLNEVISENPVVRVWRQAYQKFPSKKGARCSIESLLKRVLHGNPVGTISPTVDITNAISLKYAFPIGAENMDAFVGDIKLGVMQGGEDFLPIGSDHQDPPLAGEVAYYDDAGVVCRCWNWRDGQRTAVQDDTTNEFIAMECVEPERLNDLKSALSELGSLLEKYVGAEVIAMEIVTKDHPDIIVSE